MKWLERLHDRHHHNRRLRVLGRHLGELLPAPDRHAAGSGERLRLLDVGCGDGLLTAFVAREHPQLEVRGVDVLLREATHVPVDRFDGRRLPFPDDAFDVVMFVDVLHHADDPAALLREGARVAARWLLIKDHTLVGPLAGPTLEFMDRISNLRHRIEIPYNYWTPERWHAAFAELDLRSEEWRPKLGLYPWWTRFAFERRLHFAARLGVGPRAAAS